MSHPLLQRAHRDIARCGHVRSERVSQVMESDRPHAGSLARCDEALTDLAAIELAPRRRIGKDEIVVLLKHSAGEVLFELAGDTHGHRDPAATSSRLRRLEFASNVGLPYAD